MNPTLWRAIKPFDEVNKFGWLDQTSRDSANGAGGHDLHGWHIKTRCL